MYKPLFKKIASPDGVKFFALRERGILDQLVEMGRERERLSAPFLEKWDVIDGFKIGLFSAEMFDKVIIWGGSVRPEIVYTVPGDTVQVYPYRYTEDVLGSGDVAQTTSTPVHPIFDYLLHLEESVGITYRDDYLSFSLDSTYDHLTIAHRYEMELLKKSNILYGRIDTGSPFEIATVPERLGFTWLDELTSPQAGLIYLTGYYPSEQWNQFNTQDWWILSPVSRLFQPSAQWVPNIMYAENGNGLLATGFYYGSLGGSFRGEEAESGIQNVKVTFNTFLDNRKLSAALAPYGYAETLVSIDSTIYNEVFFYMRPSPHVDYGNPTVLNQSETFNRDAGTELHGKDWTFSVTPSFAPGEGEDYQVSMWSFTDFETEGFLEIPKDWVGVVISSGSNATIKTYNGATFAVYDSTQYHSHSISSDGRIIAIFEGTGNLITRTLVFNMETREQIRDSQIMAEIESIKAAVVPVRPSGFTATTFDIGAPATVTSDSDTWKYMAHYGMVQYNHQNIHGYLWKKVICPDGIHAQSVYFDDVCMDGSFARIIPDTSPPSGEYTINVNGEIFTGTWSQVLGKLPYVFWSAPEWPYEVVLAHWEKRYNSLEEIDEYYAVAIDVSIDRGDVIVETAPPFSVAYSESTGTYVVTNALGGYTLQTFDPPDTSTLCDAVEYTKATARDGCGRTAEIKETVGGPVGDANVQFVYGSEDTGAQIGDYFRVTGGGTITGFNASGLVFDEQGFVTEVTDCSAPGSPGATTTLTVTTTCGSASIDVRLPGGTWTQTDSCDAACFESSDGAGGPPYWYCTVPAGATCVFSRYSGTTKSTYVGTPYCGSCGDYSTFHCSGNANCSECGGCGGAPGEISSIQSKGCNCYGTEGDADAYIILQYTHSTWTCGSP